jgi:hypothetical protein
VKQVDVRGSYVGAKLPHSITAQFHTSSNKLPNEFIGGDSTSPVADLSDPDFTIPIDPPVTLRGGRNYWLRVYAVEASPYENQWFWTDRTIQSGFPAVWAPGPGFGANCTGFSPRAGSCGLDPAAPDQAFKLEGKVVSVTP